MFVYQIYKHDWKLNRKNENDFYVFTKCVWCYSICSLNAMKESLHLGLTGKRKRRERKPVHSKQYIVDIFMCWILYHPQNYVHQHQHQHTCIVRMENTHSACFVNKIRWLRTIKWPSLRATPLHTHHCSKAHFSIFFSLCHSISIFFWCFPLFFSLQNCYYIADDIGSLVVPLVFSSFTILLILFLTVCYPTLNGTDLCVLFFTPRFFLRLLFFTSFLVCRQSPPQFHSHTSPSDFSILYLSFVRFISFFFFTCSTIGLMLSQGTMKAWE